MNGNGEILAWFSVLRKTSWLSALIKCGVLCPTVMVHMMSVSVSETAQQDLECVARTFFKMDNQTGWVEWGRDHCQTPEKVHQSHAVGDLKQAKDDLTFSHFSAHFCVNEKKSSVTTPLPPPPPLESNSAGPSLLWSLYYNATVCTASQTQLASLDLPTGVFVTSDPDGTVAYENAMKEVCVCVAEGGFILMTWYAAGS